jgi:EAL domain-containing protein (putative c-di-GMP-specific phosphodiesterase class I)
VTERDGLHAWFLEGYAPSTGALERTRIDRFPFVIGRRPDLGLTLASPEVSERHAEIARSGDGLTLRDLGSTNGTFVNRRPLSGSAALRPGDVLHFADRELRLVREEVAELPVAAGTLRMPVVTLPRAFTGFGAELRALLDREAVAVRFEPIVRLADGEVMGYEALARGGSTELPQAPAELFAVAQQVGLAAELSRLCRRRAVAVAAEVPPRLPAKLPLFLNCHPDEIAEADRLVASLDELAAAGERPLVLEVHEAAVVEPGVMRRVRQELARRGIGLAYDDFGAGQARLVELSEVPPDYLKLDRRMVQGLDRAPPGRLQVLRALAVLAAELGVVTIAEGVETAAEMAACRTAGLVAAQGFHLGAVAAPPA